MSGLATRKIDMIKLRWVLLALYAMTEPVDHASSTEPADTGAVKLGFPAIEALQEASSAAGWDGEYRQMLIYAA